MRFSAKKIATGVFGISLLFVALWVIKDKSGVVDPPNSVTAKNQNSAAAADLIRKAASNVKERINVSANQREFEKSLEKGLLSLNQPMEFYGKVVDYLGRPIAGATIVYTWDVQRGIPMVSTEQSGSRTESGTDGTFQIHHKAVRWITIKRITCAGYVRPSGGDRVETDFSKEAGDSAYYSGDSDDPTLFYLIPTADIVPLYSSSEDGFMGGAKRLEMPANGTPTKVDIRSGLQDLNGELEIALSIEPRGDGLPPPWTAKIRVRGGGLVDVSSVPSKRTHEQPPFAPPDGYREEIISPVTESMSRCEMEIYLITREGLYGFVRCELSANSKGGGVRLTTRLNPTLGNRLLYFDPQKRIK